MRERDEIRMKRQARKAGNFFVSDDPKLAFVLRTRGYAWLDHGLVNKKL